MTRTVAVREHPLLFSAPMIRRLLDPEQPKTVTRRIAKIPPWADRVAPKVVNGVAFADATGRHPELGGTTQAVWCPYGGPGTRLWVKETFARRDDVDPETERAKAVHYLRYRADCGGDLADEWHPYGRWRPSIFMPRWASRITLEIESVSVERLQSITEEDAIAEGAMGWYGHLVGRAYDEGERVCCRWTKKLDPGAGVVTARGSFAALWESINGVGSWGMNDWLWRIAFRRVEACSAGPR
jgi:hypothetical protein